MMKGLYQPLPLEAAHIKKIFCAVVGIFILAITNPGQTAARQDFSGLERVALIIGNGDYTNAPLKNPPNDARAMATTLKALGFNVTVKIDINRKELRSALRQFGSRLRGNKMGFFFFAGHGLQVNNNNYLLPVGADIQKQYEVVDEAVDAGAVLRTMADAGNPLNLVFLDACRNNPYARSWRSAERGLARMTAPSGALIVYATRPGEVAADGSGQNSPFTKHIIEKIRTPGLEVGRMVRDVAIGVEEDTNGKQTPWMEGIIKGEFYFAGSSAVVEKPSQAGILLSIESNISGAEVLLGGRRIGTTPLTDYRVKAGSHRLEVLHAGYESYQRTLDFKAGRSQSLYVDLRVVAPATGRLYVDTDPSDARVKIINIGPRYYSGIELEPGSYEVEVSASGYDKKRLTARLRAGEDKYLEVRLERQTSASGGSKIRNSLGMEFVYIEPGTFMMGSPSGEEGRQEDEILHQVTLTKGYYLQTTEVTVGQWRTFVKDTGHPTDAEKDYGYVWTGSEWKKDAEADWPNPGFNQDESHPVTCVSWNDVDQFIKWLNKKGDGQYRFPTEAEWEYAARAGKSTPFHYGDSLSSTQANFDGNYPYGGAAKGPYLERTQSVGSYDSNGWGLYDMHGNVWEWVQDKAGWKGKVVTDTYRNGAVDPVSTSGSFRVRRGGSWGSYARSCRSAFRDYFTPGFRSGSLGFRLARIQ